jgi:hypothetical protein
MSLVDSHKLFTNNFKKTNEVLTTPFHPFLLNENADKELHLFCVKWNLQDGKGNLNNNQIRVGEYSIELNYRTTTNRKYSEKFPPINLNEKNLIELYNGNKISIGEESEYFKELLKRK